MFQPTFVGCGSNVSSFSKASAMLQFDLSFTSITERLVGELGSDLSAG